MTIFLAIGIALFVVLQAAVLALVYKRGVATGMDISARKVKKHLEDLEEHMRGDTRWAGAEYYIRSKLNGDIVSGGRGTVLAAAALVRPQVGPDKK